MMGRHAHHCFKQRLLTRRQAATAFSLTAFASLASSWPIISLNNVVNRRRIHSISHPHEDFKRQRFLQERTLSIKAGSEFPGDEWKHLLPFEDWSHNSAKIVVPDKIENDNKQDEDEDVFDKANLSDCLESTVAALCELEKSSLWVEVPISRSSLIEEMANLGFQFHHAEGNKSVLNLWLKNSESLIPEFATHHIGVGALVINSRDEVLVVRELRRNVMPWKIPGGLADLGEHIDEAAVREVFEETGIRTKFRNVVCFRHSHEMAHARSDIYFVCRLDPIEETDKDGNVLIPEPVAQEDEIEATAWIPYSEFSEMVTGENGHPMIRHVLHVSERGDTIDRKLINSILPGRKANPIYSAPLGSNDKSR